MTAIKATDVARVLKGERPEAVFLIYGPDHGLVSERAREAAELFVGRSDDPFAITRLDPESLAGQPGKLVEEASTFGLFGGRRAIWVRAGDVRPLPAALAPCLDIDLPATRIVVEAGDLKPTAPLRSLCEGSRRALALPCYPDPAATVDALVSDRLAEAGLSLEPGARDLLMENLGGDRMATRAELDKLILYAHGQQEITVADIQACITDVSSLEVDGAIEAAFVGDAVTLAETLSRLTRAGANAHAVLPLALSRSLALLTACVSGPGGGGWRGAGPKRESFDRQLRGWSEDRLRRAVALLQSATLRSRSAASLADATLSDALLSVARLARRR